MNLIFRKSQFALLVIAATCVFSTSFIQVKAQRTHAALPKSKHGFIVIAHRGNHVNVPENTLAAVQEAIKAGADYVEIDLRTTKDGFLVLSHDATVDRMTNGKGEVKDLILDEIKKLQVINPNKRTDQKIYHIPEFKDILNACKNQINIYLDFKDADPMEAYKQIKEAGMEKQIVVYLNKTSDYSKWKNAAPDMPLMTSLPEQISTAEQLAYLLGQVQLEVLDNIRDSAMLAMANKKGVAVWLDVQSANEDKSNWEQALGLGVQGMQTDHPEALVAYLKKTNQRDNAKFSVNSNPSTPTSYRKLLDVSYGTDPENKMDVYFPLEYDDARVIVYIHGGGWTGGDKSEFPESLTEELVGQKKYILVSMNYRLIRDGKNRFPAQIEDVSRLLSFIDDKSGRFHYRKGDFALMGGSAGAYLAMLYAYGYDSLKEIKTVVDFWGPTDLSDKAVRENNPDADSKVVNLLGVADSKDPLCKLASPYYRISKTSGVPTLLFHGGKDPLVDVSQAEKMYKKLLELGIPAQLELYPEEKHGLSPATAIDAFSKTIKWLEKYYPAK
ncbi:MAG: alpha/beta hydrolase fold domain-containing protein [Bacteroidetes bacterium]|nr:alpha/beta hydrolase fold domain-containing protein [Bacteroidota bacterium]